MTSLGESQKLPACTRRRQTCLVCEGEVCV